MYRRPLLQGTVAVLALAVFVVTASPIHAADAWWDTNGATAERYRFREATFGNAQIDRGTGKPGTGLDGGKSQDCGSHVCASVGGNEHGYSMK